MPRRVWVSVFVLLAALGMTAGCSSGRTVKTAAGVPPTQRVVPGETLRPLVPQLSRTELLRELAAERARLQAVQARNPLAQHPFGVYAGPLEPAWSAYAAARGDDQRLLSVIAQQPKAIWLGDWVPDDQIGQRVHDYIDGSQHGNPNALVQMSVFRMVPWEAAACHRAPSGDEAASYKHWIDSFAAAVGDTPTAIILQPDGPFALCAPSGVPSQLVAYAAQKLSALPHTSVYIDAGAGDWPADGAQGGVAAAVRLLIADGVRSVRGFALNSTHYSATPVEVARGAAIAQALAAQGIAGKKFVVNTSSSGHPFPFGAYRGGDPDDARVCPSLPSDDTCIALGIPPTTQVADPRWHLPPTTNLQAEQYCDAYLWFGRPWLYRQNSPFRLDRALALAHTWQY